MLASVLDVNNNSVNVEMYNYTDMYTKEDGTEYEYLDYEALMDNYDVRKELMRYEEVEFDEVSIKHMLKMIKNSGLTPDASKLRKKKIKSVKNKKIRKAFKQRSLEDRNKSLAYLLGISIKRKGIKPNHFVDKVMNDDLFRKIENDLSTALQRDVELTFI